MLNKIDAIYLLNEVARDIYITPTIKMEFGKKLPQWIKVKAPMTKNFKEVVSDIDALLTKRSNTDFRISNTLIETVREQAKRNL